MDNQCENAMNLLMTANRINAVLMHMGGDRCRSSHLMKNQFCSRAELDQLIVSGYLIEIGEFVIKTEKARKVW